MAGKPLAWSTFGRGDFNSTMDEVENRSGELSSVHHKTDHYSPTLLQHSFSSLQLLDIWRTFHPLDWEYAHYSHVHKTFSRIDYLFGTPDTHLLIENSQIHEIAISDHSPVTIDFRDTMPISTHRVWHFPAHLAMQKSFRSFYTRSGSSIQSWIPPMLPTRLYFGRQAKLFFGNGLSHTPPLIKKSSQSNFCQPEKI